MHWQQEIFTSVNAGTRLVSFCDRSSLNCNGHVAVFFLLCIYPFSHHIKSRNKNMPTGDRRQKWKRLLSQRTQSYQMSISGSSIKGNSWSDWIQLDNQVKDLMKMPLLYLSILYWCYTDGCRAVISHHLLDGAIQEQGCRGFRWQCLSSRCETSLQTLTMSKPYAQMEAAHLCGFY